MITNEDALQLIKQHGECYVVWATDRNMIVAVHPIPMDANVNERFSALSEMSTDYDGPVKGRFLFSDSTTLQTLIDESERTDRVAIRGQIFNSWRNFTVDQLIETLVTADFSEPMDAFHGSAVIVDRLYKVFGPSITSEQVSRLDGYSRSTPVDPDQSSAIKALQCYLCVLTDDAPRLSAFFNNHYSAKGDFASCPAFVDAAADLPTNDPEIIGRIINVVETPSMFGPRFNAMVALGKIGSNASERAAQVIIDAIHDSSESISRVRDYVIRRIKTPASNWSDCQSCFHGYVEGTTSQIPTAVTCKECLGIGVVPIDT